MTTMQSNFWIPRSATLLLSVCLFALELHAQSLSLRDNKHVRPMNTDIQTMAFFYKNPVVLDKAQHKSLRLKAGDALFAKQNQSVPLLVAEFPEACLEYPIVFVKGGDGVWMALALTGLAHNSNAFVDDKGVWKARYVPASVRRYPFILAETADKQLSLAADMDAASLGAEGEPLFDAQGEPTEMIRNVMNLLADFQQQAKMTEVLAQKLVDANLLVQQNLQVRIDDERSAIVDGVWIVDESKLRALPDDKVLALFKTGELSVVYAHMMSLRNLLPLLERTHQAAPQIKKSAVKSKSL